MMTMVKKLIKISMRTNSYQFQITYQIKIAIVFYILMLLHY